MEVLECELRWTRRREVEASAEGLRLRSIERGLAPVAVKNEMKEIVGHDYILSKFYGAHSGIWTYFLEAEGLRCLCS